MPCDLRFPIPVPAASIVQAARPPIERRGGLLLGDAQAGEFVVPLTLGQLKGRYEACDGALRLVITSKPLWVTCGMIHAAMTDLLQREEQQRAG